MAALTITIRKSRPADLPAADALFAESYPVLLRDDYPPSVRVLALPLISRAQPQLISSGTYYVAEDEAGRLVGAGGWTRSPRRRDIGQVRHVVTHHRLTRKGIGGALMTHIFKTARAAGIGHLQCQSTRTAVPFYAACGFRELGPIEVPLRPGIAFPAVAMERDL
jgi:GNAT superfamily N-acetyltransferase